MEEGGEWLSKEMGIEGGGADDLRWRRVEGRSGNGRGWRRQFGVDIRVNLGSGNGMEAIWGGDGLSGEQEWKGVVKG